MLIPLLLLLTWLIAAMGFFASYHRANRPIPTLAVAALASTALILAILSMLQGKGLWARWVIAALWLSAAAGLLFLWLRSRKRKTALMQAAESVGSLPASVSDLAARLEKSGFAVTKGIGPTNQAIILGQKAGFDTSRLQLVETFFMVRQFDCVDESALNTFTKECAEYAVSHRKIRLPWLHMVHIAVFYPVAASLKVDITLARNITTHPPAVHGWWGLGMPIVWDVANERVYYSQATSEWPEPSGLPWDFMRQTAAGIFIEHHR